MKAVAIKVDEERTVSGIFETPAKALACYVLAHGAGAGMKHPFLAAVATELAQRGIATLRYNFPYMEAGSKRPDTPKVAHAAVRAAVAEAARLAPGIPLYAGGKSFGGRMTSQAHSEAPLPGVRGLIFLGFPLHAPGKPSVERGDHLFKVAIPMLFLQGTRDEFAELALLEGLVQNLNQNPGQSRLSRKVDSDPGFAGFGARATLTLFDDADHSFHVPARTGRKDPQVRAAVLDALAAWVA